MKKLFLIFLLLVPNVGFANQFMKGEALVLDEKALPSAGVVDGEVRFSSADQTLRRWNSSLSSWVKLGGGGGGGSALVWKAEAGVAPIETEEFGEVVYEFVPAALQNLNTWIKVPDSYTPGNQVTIRIAHYSLASSGTALISVRSRLIRKNVDPVDFNTNQHASTNSAVTNTVAKQYREINADITDASGKINAVAVSPGDLLKIEITRGTDTDTTDIKFIPSATEVLFE